MERLFTAHTLRKTCEPTALWRFDAPEVLGEESVLLHVPGPWARHPRLTDYRGAGVYTKEVTLAGNVRFVFEGVSGAAWVCLDGQELAREAQPNTPFACVAEDLEWGQHTLTVAVDAQGAIGGLTGAVTVEQLGSAWIRAVRVTPQRQGRLWRTAVQVEVVSLSDEAQTIDVETHLAGSERRWKGKQLPPHGVLTLKGELPLGQVKPWSPAHPTLYKVETVLWQEGTPADDLIDRVGFREAISEDGHFLLNGKRLSLQGVTWHGMDRSLAGLTADVQWMKTLGFNAICVEQAACTPTLLELCDQLGLLVWSAGRTAENHPCVMADAAANWKRIPLQAADGWEKQRDETGVLIETDAEDAADTKTAYWQRIKRGMQQ